MEAANRIVQSTVTDVLLNEKWKINICYVLWKTGDTSVVTFRSWDLYEFPLLHRTTKHSWAIKTATLEAGKSQYVIFALQTDRKNVMDTNWFDNCKLNNVKLYLNLECYPIIWIWISIKTDGRFFTRTHVFIKLLRIQLSRAESNCHVFSA